MFAASAIHSTRRYDRPLGGGGTLQQESLIAATEDTATVAWAHRLPQCAESKLKP